MAPGYLVWKKSDFETGTFTPTLKAIHLKGAIKLLDQI